MTFPKLLAEIQNVKAEEKRQQTAEYLEMVIAKDALELLHKILVTYFGPPIKPEGRSPNREASRHAKPHGGIRKDQTMYFRRGAEYTECVLLWPWGGGARVTVKVIQSRSSVPEANWKSFLGNIFIRR